MNVWRWMSPTNEGNEEENKHEDSRLPYSSIVKGPSVKKQVISIIVILGVKDLIGDIHFLFFLKDAYERCRKEIFRLFSLLIRDRGYLPIRMKKVCQVSSYLV